MARTLRSAITTEELWKILPWPILKRKAIKRIQGTQGLVTLISWGQKEPNYFIKEYLAGRDSYELERSVFLAVPESELEEKFNGRKVKIMPKVLGYNDQKKWLLFPYIPYEDAKEQLKKASTSGEKLDILTYSLESLACLHYRLNQRRKEIESKVNIEKLTSKNLTEKIISCLEILYGTKRQEWPPFLLKELQKSLEEVTAGIDSFDFLIHGAYYANHVKLNEKESINLDMGNVKRGPLEFDLGCFLADVYPFFKDEEIDIVDYAMRVYCKRIKALEGRHGELGLAYELKEERVRLGMFYYALRKASGIKARGRKHEVGEITSLSETAYYQLKVLGKKRKEYKLINEKIEAVKDKKFSDYTGYKKYITMGKSFLGIL